MFVTGWICRYISRISLARSSSDATSRSMAIEAAHCPNTSLADVETLFPIAGGCEKCSIPADWASPLTCLWLDDDPPAHMTRQIPLLAGFVHRWLATFLDGDCRELLPSETMLDERAILREQIERFEPVSATSNSESDAMYESCRWASLVLLAVEEQGIPIHIAAKHVRIRPRLVRRLRMTDLSSLWGARRGLLFWVTSVCYFATAGQCFPLICTTLFARFTQEFAMSPYCSEIAIRPLRRLKTFESLCISSESTR